MCIKAKCSIILWSLASVDVIHLLPPLSHPFSLFAPPFLILLLTPISSHPPSFMCPADNMKRFRVIITLITLCSLSTPIPPLYNEENCRSSGRSLCELNRSKQAFTHSSPSVKSITESSTTDVLVVLLCAADDEEIASFVWFNSKNDDILIGWDFVPY